jgi:PhzF family phenazine biosynthesis protein
VHVSIVDAFTERPFAGNPAGVVLLEGAFPDDDWLHHVAAEIGLPETAFVVATPADPEAGWALRWFTPTTEVNMCGHATLAAAHAMRGRGLADGSVRFTTRSGVLSATVADDGSVTLDFPTSPLRRIDPPAEVAEALGAEVLSVHETGAAVGEPVVEVADEQTVRSLVPNLALVARLPWRGGAIVTARADASAVGYDFVSRCFFPGIGIDEDPVTGAAHTALAPFWAQRLGSTSLVGLQASPRSGLVRTELCGDRTLLRGSAVTVIEGDLLVPLPAS